MRKILIACALLLGMATLALAASAGAHRDVQAAALARAAGAPDDVVTEMLQRHAALLAAIDDGASVEMLMAVGRMLVAAQLASPPEAQRQPLNELAALSKRLLNHTLAMLRSLWICGASARCANLTSHRF